MKKYRLYIRKETKGYAEFDLEEGQTMLEFLDSYDGENVVWNDWSDEEIEYVEEIETTEEVMDYQIKG
jgi:hypothetical protein